MFSLEFFSVILLYCWLIHLLRKLTKCHPTISLSSSHFVSALSKYTGSEWTKQFHWSNYWDGNKWHKYGQSEYFKWHHGLSSSGTRSNNRTVLRVYCFSLVLVLSLIFIWLSPIGKKGGNTYFPWLKANNGCKTCVFKLFGNCFPSLWHKMHTNYRIVSDRTVLHPLRIVFISLLCKFVLFCVLIQRSIDGTNERIAMRIANAR